MHVTRLRVGETGGGTRAARQSPRLPPARKPRCSAWAGCRSNSAATPYAGSGWAMPKVFPDFEAADALIETLHMWDAYAMLALAAGHTAAAFKHRWLDGHDVIRRMTIGGRKAR